MKNSKKGFTLIELLIIVAIVGIVGILSSAVLAFIDSARTRANVASAKNEMNQARTIAEVVFAKNGNSYNNICPFVTTSHITGPGLGDPDGNFYRIILSANNYALAAYPDAGRVDCISSDFGYSVTLYFQGSTFCIDSKGFSGLGHNANASGYCTPLP